MNTHAEHRHEDGGGLAAHETLSHHHAELDRRLAMLVTRAQCGDPADLRGEWSAFERLLLRHLELEEAEILPGFARTDPGAAREILAEHGAIRSQLLEMGLCLDLHLLRADRVADLADHLRAHAQREEAAFYPWAGRHLTPGGHGAITRGLHDAHRPRE